MTNGNNLAKANHLESTAANIKRYVLSENLGVLQAVAAELADLNNAVLDTTPATQNGALWYEIQNSKPVIKIFYGGREYSIGTAQTATATIFISRHGDNFRFGRNLQRLNKKIFYSSGNVGSNQTITINVSLLLPKATPPRLQPTPRTTTFLPLFRLMQKFTKRVET